MCDQNTFHELAPLALGQTGLALDSSNIYHVVWLKSKALAYPKRRLPRAASAVLS